MMKVQFEGMAQGIYYLNPEAVQQLHFNLNQFYNYAENLVKRSRNNANNSNNQNNSSNSNSASHSLENSNISPSMISPNMPVGASPLTLLTTAGAMSPNNNSSNHQRQSSSSSNAGFSNSPNVTNINNTSLNPNPSSNDLMSESNISSQGNIEFSTL